MKKIGIGTLFIFFILSGGVFAQSPDEIYQKANLSYEDADYESSVSLYEMLLKMDKVSPEVFYNLGNSYFKLKKIGKAILNYERAQQLAPRDRDVLRNLKLARSMTVDKIKTLERGFVLRIVLFLYDTMNINELSIFTSIIYLVAVIILGFSIFIVTKRRTLFYAAGTLGAILIIFLIFLVSKIYNENFVRKAIVISGKVDVRSGPNQDYLLQFTLHEGTKVRVVEEKKDWYEIDLSKDLRGWLPRDSVEVI